MLSASHVRNLAAITAALAAVYLVAFGLVWAVITPVQQQLLPDLTRFVSLMFLPHGVRVFATSLLGGRSVPGLVLGALAGNYLLWGVHDPETLVLTSLIAGTSTWAVFEGLRSLRVNAFYLQVTEEPPPFHTLMLAGILSSVANAFLLTTMVEGRLSAGHVTTVLAAYVTGDITGLLAVMIAARHVAPRLGRFIN